MSLFFEYPCDYEDSKDEKNDGADVGVVASSWCTAERNILAVAMKGGKVDLFLEEGERLEPEGSFTRASTCSVLIWNPKYPALACGWGDGCVSIFVEKGNIFKEDKKVHKAKITVLKWTPDGSKLVSGDESGVVSIWNVDSRGRLALSVKFGLPQMRVGGIALIQFRAAHDGSIGAFAQAQQSQALAKHQDINPNACPPFFIGKFFDLFVGSDFCDICRLNNVMFLVVTPLHHLPTS
jgi:WD40 repeat protein